MATNRWTPISEAARSIDDPEPKAALLAAMRRGDLPWRGFLYAIVAPPPEKLIEMLKNPLVIASLASMKPHQIKRAREVGSYGGHNAHLASVRPDQIDWDKSELVVADQFEPQLRDICVDRTDLDRLWKVPAPADLRAEEARKLKARNQRIKALADEKRRAEPSISGNRVAKALFHEYGDEFDLSEESFRKLTRERQSNSAG